MTWLRSDKVWNSASRRFEPAFIRLSGKKIEKVEWGKARAARSKTIDFGSLCIGPSAIDLHVHCRDFEESHKETMGSLEAAAFAGGVSTAVCMANTRPRLDTVKQVKAFFQRARSHLLQFECFAAVTENLDGQKPTDWAALLRLPIVGLSDDGKPLLDEKMMEAVLRQCHRAKKLLSVHEEDTGISCGSVLQLSEVSMRGGITGSPAESESHMVERDLRLAKKLGAHIHFCHISSEKSVRLFQAARKKVSFSAELTPHHALLETEDFESLGVQDQALFKVCPVIRSQKDRRALLQALKSGLIDCFASDHAPHSKLEKEMPIGLAAHGIVSFENYYPLYLEVRRQARMSWDGFFRAISERPAELLGQARLKGKIEEGFEASFVVFDPEASLELSFSKSKSTNSPLGGRRIQGKVVEHWLKGSKVYAS